MTKVQKAGGASSPFATPLFRTMWIAVMISNLGGMIQAVGAGWLMTAMSDSPLMVAMVQASTSLPILLLSLWAGAVADNLDRRRVMLLTQCFMFAAATLLTALAASGRLTPELLLVLTFAIGCGTAINWPSMQMSFGDIVPRPALPRAVALNGMSVNVARSVGPAVGGAVVVWAGATATFFLNSLSYVGLIAVLFRWHPPKTPSDLPRERLGAAMLAGLRYGAMSPMIGALLFRASTYGAFAGAIQALLPLIARDLIGGGALTFGFLLGSFGLGAIVGALCSTRMRRAWTTEAIIRNASLLAAAGTALAAASNILALALLAMAMIGASWLIMLSTFNVTIQLSTPRWVGARALSLYQMSIYGGAAAGSALFGYIAAHHGLVPALLLSALGLVLVAIIGYRWPLNAGSDADLGPRDDWAVPGTRIPIDLDGGPVVVLIEYQVAEENEPRFVTLMQQRSRILRRDGARQWSLCRDLADPVVWTERYRLSTWFDYVRLNQRRTQADLTIQGEIKTLLILGTQLNVRRLLERQYGASSRSRASDLIEPSATSG